MKLSLFFLIVAVTCEYDPEDRSVDKLLRNILLHQKSDVVESRVHANFTFKNCDGIEHRRAEFISDMSSVLEMAYNLDKADFRHLGGSVLEAKVDMGYKTYTFETGFEGDKLMLMIGTCELNKIPKTMDDIAYFLPTDGPEENNTIF